MTLEDQHMSPKKEEQFMKMALGVFIVFLALVFTTHMSYAVLPFSIGAKAGVNIANLSFDPDNLAAQGINKTTRVGFKFGAILELGVGGPVYIALEPLYAQKGAKGDAQTPFGPGKLAIEASYLEIPALIKLKFGVPGLKPYVFAGPNIGFLLSANLHQEVGSQTSDTDVKSTTSSTDFALDVGAGAEFGVAKLVAITVDARYSLGLSNTNSDPQDPTKVKTTGIQILVGVMFSI